MSKLAKTTTIATLLLALAWLGAIAQTPAEPALYYPADSIGQSLNDSLDERPGMGVGRIQNGEDFRINLIQRSRAAGPIVHEEGTELHYITGGVGTLLTGGVVVRPADGGAARIEGGVARRVVAGDAILIPAGTPHQYTAVEGEVSYLEVRFDAREYR